MIDEFDGSAEQLPTATGGSAGGSSHPAAVGEHAVGQHAAGEHAAGEHGALDQPATTVAEQSGASAQHAETSGGDRHEPAGSAPSDATGAAETGHPAIPPAAESSADVSTGFAPAGQGEAEAQPAPKPAAKKPARPPGEPIELDESDDTLKPTGNRDWYILKVQSNREDSIREALLRKIHMAGMDDFFGDIIVPIEMVSEFKNGKKRVVKRKLYPGYLVVHMELNEETWFLVRETHGIGDFTGSGGKPSPMLPHEVSRILSKQEEKADEAPKLNIKFRPGDRVKITEGTFENFEGDVDAIDEANGRVTVMINIFGRSTPVELEYWQVESL